MSIGWVVLSATFSDYDLDDVLRACEAAFPGAFVPPQAEGCFVVDGPTAGQFLAKSTIPGAEGLFLITMVPGRYVSPEMAATIRDPALRERALAQRAWMSIDPLLPQGDESDPFGFISPVLARLAPPSATLLLTNNLILPFDDSMRARLAAGLTPSQMEAAPGRSGCRP